MGENGGRVIKGHVYRTHGQSQSGVGLRVGGEDGGAGGSGEVKWRQLYLNTKNYLKIKEKNNKLNISDSWCG